MEQKENPCRRRTDNENEESVDINTGFGRIRAKGVNVIAVVLGVGAVFAIGFMIRDHDVRASERADARAVVTVEKLDKVAAQVKSAENSVNEMAYILTLSQKDRERLNLSMPESLRTKLLSQERNRDNSR